MKLIITLDIDDTDLDAAKIAAALTEQLTLIDLGDETLYMQPGAVSVEQYTPTKDLLEEGQVMLQDMMNQVQSELRAFHVEAREFAGRELFLGRTWLTNDPLGPYPERMKALLLRVPVNVYVHERRDGSTYDVLTGGEFIEGLRFHTQNVFEGEVALRRRLMDTNLRIVVFRCTMSQADVETAMKYIA